MRMEERHLMGITQENEISEVLSNFSPYLISLRKGEKFQKEMAQKFAKNATFRVVMCAEEIAGFVAFYVNNQVDKIAYISMIAVKEKFRKQGIGGLLLKECEKVSKLNAMKKINLEVLLDNISAIDFYKRNGFKCIENRKTTLLMSKDISK